MKPQWFKAGEIPRGLFVKRKGWVQNTESYVTAIDALSKIHNTPRGEGFRTGYTKEEIAQLPSKNPVEALRAALQRFITRNEIKAEISKPKSTKGFYFIEITRV